MSKDNTLCRSSQRSNASPYDFGRQRYVIQLKLVSVKSDKAMKYLKLVKGLHKYICINNDEYSQSETTNGTQIAIPSKQPLNSPSNSSKEKCDSSLPRDSKAMARRVARQEEIRLENDIAEIAQGFAEVKAEMELVHELDIDNISLQEEIDKTKKECTLLYTRIYDFAERKLEMDREKSKRCDRAKGRIFSKESICSKGSKCSKESKCKKKVRFCSTVTFVYQKNRMEEKS